MKPFSFSNPELLGLGRQTGQKNSGAFGVFSAELSQWEAKPRTGTGMEGTLHNDLQKSETSREIKKSF